MSTETLEHEPAPGAAPARAGARVTFEHISRRFGGLSAVHDVSLELAPGEILCLLGPSGCGKTTLLRIAAGLERQNAGRVLIDGEEIAGPNRFVPPEKRGIGLMFQDFALFPHLTIAANVAFGLTEFDDRDTASAVGAALDRVGLHGFADAYPHTLSGGEQQRAALARAIAPRPGVLLMDEPFSGLDRSLRESVRDDTLSILKESRASSILVTHDAEEAMIMADRIVLMRAGRLVQTGTPIDLYRHPVDADVARFFSEVNEFRATVAGGVAPTPLASFPAPGIGEGAAVVILVREHDLHMARAGGGAAARVVAARFIGEFTQVDAELEASNAMVRLRVPGLVRIRPGDLLRVAADPELAHVFAVGGECA
jgi:iron(III) transport system ATP-binding protein